MSLFEDARPGGNAPEFTVSEIAGAVKRVIEGEFGRVRVRGEIGRVSRPASGHVYSRPQGRPRGARRGDLEGLRCAGCRSGPRRGWRSSPPGG